MKKTIITILFTVALLNLFSANHPIKTLTIENGLSSNFIRTIYGDKQGLIWIGTDTGLDSYDGIEIASYNKRFKTPLKGAVQSVVSNNDGSLWIGSEQGAFLYQIKGNKLTPVNFESQGINIRKVLKTSDDKIYFGSDKGLFAYKSETNTAQIIHLNNRFKSRVVSITDIVEDNSGNLWLASFDGLYSYNPTSKQSQHFDIDGLNFTNNIRCLLKFDNSHLYLGTENGLFGFDLNTKNYRVVKGTENLFILSLATDKNQIYIGTENEGVYGYDLRQNTLLPIQTNKSAQKSNLSIHALFCANNTLWAGTFTEGIKYIDLISRPIFKPIDLFNSYGISPRSFFFDGKAYYVGTRDGLAILDQHFALKKIYKPTNTKGLDARVITTIYPCPLNPNCLLLGTYGGGAIVYNKQKGTFSDFTTYDLFKKGSVYKFYYDQKDLLWIASLEGLYNYNIKQNKVSKYNLTGITGSNEIFSLHRDNSNRLWVGTKLGACYIDLFTKKAYQPELLKTYKYQCTAINSSKTQDIWFCFNKGGVLKASKSLQLENWITSEIGLPENAPSSLIEDKFGNMWIGTQKGLFKATPKGEIFSYSFDDGLNGLIISPESAYRDSKNDLWWLNEFGFITFNNARSISPKQNHALIFADLYINGNKYSADTLSFVEKESDNKYRIKITGKNNNNLALRFAYLNFHNAKMNSYSYKLIGVDNTSHKSTISNIVSYDNLPIGTYTLLVTASNNENSAQKQSIEVEISITPYYYESILFIVLIWVIIASLTFYFTKSYFTRVISKIKNQFEELKNKQSSNANAATTLKISTDKCKEIAEALDRYMKTEKPFLNPDLKQAEVANAINYPVHELSQVLNVHLQSNFPDYINSFRVEELKECIANKVYPNYNVTAIAEKCGFNSKTTFYRAFKKFTGESPAEYFKEN